MKVKVIETVKTEREVEVTLPIYRKLIVDTDYSTITHYARISQRQPELGVSQFVVDEIRLDSDGDCGYSTKDHHFAGGEREYELGEGEYKSSEEEWNQAWAEAINRFQRVISLPLPLSPAAAEIIATKAIELFEKQQQDEFRMSGYGALMYVLGKFAPEKHDEVMRQTLKRTPHYVQVTEGSRR